MGFIRKITDGIIPLPEARYYFDSDNSRIVFCFRVPFAVLNLFFQTLYCVIIPFFSIVVFTEVVKCFSTLLLLIAITTLVSSVIVLYQTMYCFFNPKKNYITIMDRMLGETAVGAFISAVFKIRIEYEKQ